MASPSSVVTFDAACDGRSGWGPGNAGVRFEGQERWHQRIGGFGGAFFPMSFVVVVRVETGLFFGGWVQRYVVKDVQGWLVELLAMRPLRWSYLVYNVNCDVNVM